MACPLFEENIKKYNFIELIEWIIKCRHFVDKSVHNSETDYQNSVSIFCKEWRHHYFENSDFYRSNKYRNAILSVGRLNQFRFTVDSATESVDITNDVLSNLPSSVFKQSKKDDPFHDLITDFGEFNEKINDCFCYGPGFKKKLNAIITDFYFNKKNIKFRVFKDNQWFKVASYKDFMAVCEDPAHYKIEPALKMNYGSYLQALESFDIPKSTYTEYMSLDKAEKAYDKKFFINLSFVLSLTLDYAERMLQFNGYSIESSIKAFDTICETAFRLGFSREYVIALIDKYNADMKSQYPNFVEVQNITKIKR